MQKIWVPLSKCVVSATVVQSSTRTVADRHRLAAHCNKDCWRAFQGYQRRWPWMTLNSKIGFYSDFARFLAATHISRVNCVEIIGDRPSNLQMEFSALNVDFNSASFDPHRSSSPLYECIKFGYPLENVRFLLLSTNLAWERLQIDTDLLRDITSTADELSGGTNIHDLERPWTPKISGLTEFFSILGCDAHLEWIFAEIYWRQSAY